MANPDDERPWLRFDDDVATLKRKTGQGAAVVVVAQVLQTIMAFVSAVILARLLTPADFGLIAMAAPVYVLATLIANMGIGQAVIQRPHITHGELSNLYWWSLAIFGAGAVILALSAPLISRFYGVTEVTGIVLVYAALMVISGASAMHGSVLLRRLKFIQQGVIAVVGRLIGIAAGIATAVYTGSYWAILVMEAVAGICRLAMIWLMSGWSPDRYDRATPVGGLLKFGANVALTRILTYATDNVAAVLIGKMWGQVALGFYDRAYRLVLAPTTRTTGAIAPAAQAILGRLASNPDRYRRAFLSLNRLALLAIAPGVLWMVIQAPRLVPLLLGEGWDAVVPIFQAFGVLAMVRLMVVMFNWLLIAEGRDRELRQWGIFRALVIIAAIVIGVRWGAFGVAVAYAGVVTLLLTPIHIYWVARGSAVSAGDLIKTVLMFTPGFAAATGVLVFLMSRPDMASWVNLLLGLIASYSLIWLIVLLQPAGRSAVRHGFEVAVAAMSRSEPDLSAEADGPRLP